MSLSSESMRVGLIGLGTIGAGVIRIVKEKYAQDVTFVAALVRDAARSRPVGSPKTVTTVEELLAERPEVVVEAGGHAALRAYGPPLLRAGVDLITVSVGAFSEPGLDSAIEDAAREGGGRLKIASGAIGGLDVIASARVGGLNRVTHTTRKPARTLLGPEGDDLTEPKELFRGTAREGTLLFPESINVAAAVSLAGLGLDRTEVVVIADPAISRNQHEVEVEGDFGWCKFEIRNIPTVQNPKTGRIVAMSVAHTLLMRRQLVAIG